DRLADRTGLEPGTVRAALRSGGGAPGAATVAVLADALGLPVGPLLELRRIAAQTGESRPSAPYAPQPFPGGVQRAEVDASGQQSVAAMWIGQVNQHSTSEPKLKHLAPPRALPPGFTGRDEDLEELLGFLSPATDSDDGTEHAVVVASVLGMGGMGKTTLALAAAHAALERALFTGVLFLDLHGYDETPVDADRALDTALRDLGIGPEQIPPETDQRAALYRAQLAARARAGERVLVLADNTSDSSQVAHLLPAGSGPHRMLVTSRDNLAPDLGARLLDLDVLTPERAVALMDAALRVVRPTDDRITADPTGAARVAELCGHLPLALRIAAAQLGRNLKPAQLAEELENLAERLDVLEGRDAAVRTVLAGSYRRLAPTHAELFRALALNPGPDLSTQTAAALTGVGKLRDVRKRLEALADASLVREDPDTGRWRMHDLVRAYATE
ncbi:NB-ARC domain-containing protein, partial [Kitasatospora sp. NPDC088134]|uniref:NB-ARC domain-containing protein n=1 Tax=Kitasatospora sp. NPDC088134 TaxID=3364071 RepID=UPI00382DC1DA